MTFEKGKVYRFGSFVLEGHKGLLYHGSELVSLPPKIAKTLLVLVENHGKVVDKEVLLKSVWPDAFVEESNLHHNISVLRKLLQSDAATAARIDTLPKRGYRLVGEVTVVEPEADYPAAPMDIQRAPAPEPVEVLDLPEKRPRIIERRLWPRFAAVAILALTAGAALWLARAGTATKATGIAANSIVVLPFSNFSADRSVEFLSDGMTDELIHQLTRIPNLRVVARTSAFQFKGKSVDLRQVGERLQARLVLEGSVQKDGHRLRVTAQLIDAVTGFHLWSERFDRTYHDLFAIQDEICQAIAGALSLQLSERSGVWRSQKLPNMEVYTLYLRGLKEWNRRNRAGVNAGREFFERALVLDSSYASAWAGLADTLVHSGIWSLSPPHEVFPKAKAAALRAIELDPQLAAPHTALGYVQGWHERNHMAAEASFRRALDLSPGYSWGRQRLASYLSTLGRHQEAIREQRRALELDPVSPSANAGLALALFWSRDYDGAIEQCARTRDIDPQFPLTYYYLAHSLEQKGNYEEAIAALKEGTRLWGSNDNVMLTQLLAAARGHRDEALTSLKDIQERAASGEIPPYQVALIYSALGEKEKALDWLDRASRAGDVWFMYANVDPRLDAVRSDNRFQKLIGRFGFN